jgi:hypothetical protein
MPPASRPCLLRQHPPYRRAPQAQVPRNRRLIQALLRQCPNLRGIVGFGARSAMRLPAFARIGNACLNSLTDYIALKLCEHGQEACESAPCRGRADIPHHSRVIE